MKRYYGYRQYETGPSGEPIGQKCVVRVREVTPGLAPRRDPVGKNPGRILPMHLKIRNHSSTGFEWGYLGSGPAQLALALIVDCMGPRYALPTIYQEFKRRVVANLARDGWALTADQIKAVVAVIIQEHWADLEHQLEGAESAPPVPDTDPPAAA